MRGGEARIVSIAADTISLRSTVPWPPGARVEGALVDDPRTTLRVKVHGCRRQPDGEYELDGRGLDLPKALRTFLETALLRE
jgi:hypothetical protein